MSDYRRGGRQSGRNEVRRREQQAPLLHAAGVLRPMPSIEDRIEQRRAAEGGFENARQRREAQQRQSIDLYRRTIVERHGDTALAEADAKLQVSCIASRGLEYHADFYCGYLSVLTGWTKLETFERMRGLDKPSGAPA